MDFPQALSLPMAQWNGGNGLLYGSNGSSHLAGNGISQIDMGKVGASAHKAVSVSKVAAGPLPLSFFGEEEDDLFVGTVPSSNGGYGDGKETTEESVNHKPAVHAGHNNGSSTHGGDLDDDFEFGDFESVPARLPSSSSSGLSPAVDSSRLVLPMHGLTVSADLQYQSEQVQHGQAPQSAFTSVPTSGALPDLTHLAASIGPLSMGTNSTREESSTVLDQMSESLSDDEWGDFVAPVAPLSQTSPLESATWGSGSGFNDNAQDSFTFDQVLCGQSDDHAASNIQGGSSISFPGESFQEGDISLQDKSKPMPSVNFFTDALIQESDTILQDESNPMPSLNFFTDAPTFWDPLSLEAGQPKEVAVTDLKAYPDTKDRTLEFLAAENQVDPVNLDLEDDDTWDWVAAETTDSGSGSKISDMENLKGTDFVAIQHVASNSISDSSDGRNQHLDVSPLVLEQVTSGNAVTSSRDQSSSTAEVVADDQNPVHLNSLEGEVGTDTLKKGVLGISAAPLPLSIFGEDEFEHNSALDLKAVPVNDEFSNRSRSTTRTNSLKLTPSNFSDVIASLYPDSPTAEVDIRKASHRRSRSSSIQVSSSSDLEFFFRRTDSHPLGSPLTGVSNMVATDSPDIDGSGMLDADVTSENGTGEEWQELDQAVVWEDFFKMDLLSMVKERVSIDGSYIDGFSFQYREETNSGADEPSDVDSNLCSKPITVAHMGDEAVHTLQKLQSSLISEGRVLEAHRCHKHTLAISSLPLLQESYFAAMELGEFEKAASTRKEIEISQAGLAKPEELTGWQIRQRHVERITKISSCEAHHKQVSTTELSRLTLNEMLELLGDHDADTRAVVMKSLFDADKIISLAKSDLKAAVDLHTDAVHTFRILVCATTEEQQLCVKAWSKLASVCVGELEHASNIWQRAVDAGADTHLLDSKQGRNFFSAVGQVFMVSCILGATLKVYKPWLAVAEELGQGASEAVEQCYHVWLESGLKDAVCFSLGADIQSLPMTVASWFDIQKLPSAGTNAMIQAVGRSVSDRSPYHFCALSLLPLLPFTAIPAVEWEGQHYLLPLANLWANRISREAPKLPIPKIGGVRA